ncbi:hypothetical protein [Flavobacterium sp. N2820]|uniref:hypothetical protein n=1 Tax=Flavobacterium sp. N2820 TaxID=2986834 RepID=UPI0022253DF4|nr:hypothetical protein [Flavobacterium sp. N2820]
MQTAECVEIQNQTAIHRSHIEPRYNRVPRFSNGFISVEVFESTPFIISMNKNQRYLIKLSQKFDTLKALVDYNKFDNQEIKKAFNNISNSLVSLNPDNIDFEFTTEDSLLFTFKKDDFVSFFEFYIEDEEVLFTAFKNDVKLKSYSGNINDSIKKIKSYL